MRGGERAHAKEEGQRQEVLASSAWQAHQAGVCPVHCRYCRQALGLPVHPKEPHGHSRRH